MDIDTFLHSRDAQAAMAGLGAFGMVAFIWLALMENDRLSSRLRNVSERRSELRKQEKKKKMTRRPEAQHADLIKQIVQKFKLEQGRKMDELRLKLAQAGFRSRDMLFTFVLMKAIMPLVGGLAGFFFIFVLKVGNLKTMMALSAVMGCVVGGMYLPDIFIKNRSQKRMDSLRKGMPDALDLLVICAEAGLSLDSAMDRVSREIGPTNSELAEEVGLTGVELGFLPDRAKALQNLADRVPLPGVVALSNTLIQTEKYGTPLARALRVLSAEMRDERIMAAEAKAAKLPATLTVPMILFILPPLFIVLMGPAVLKVMALSN